MVYWRFTQAAGWQEITPPVDAMNDNEELRDWLARTGYSGHVAEIGDDLDGGSFSLYERQGDEAPLLADRYFACVNFPDGNFWQAVFLPSFPDCLGLAQALAPLWTMTAIGFRLKEMEGVLEKAFYAWHGHSPWSGCRHCDPFYEARKQGARRQQPVQPPPQP